MTGNRTVATLTFSEDWIIVKAFNRKKKYRYSRPSACFYDCRGYDEKEEK